MFVFLLVIQYLSMAILAMCVGKLFFGKPSQMANLMILIAVCSLINQVGTTMSMQANTMDGALIGIKIAYLGKLPILLCLMIFIVRYCGAKPTKPLLSVIGGLSAANIAILISVWTTDSNHLFYKTIDYVDGKLFRHLAVTICGWYRLAECNDKAKKRTTFKGLNKFILYDGKARYSDFKRNV